MARPESHFKGKDRAKTLRAGMPLVHTSGTDIDNLIKFTLDAMEGVVCMNSSQCVKVIASKLHDNKEDCEGHTVVLVGSGWNERNAVP